MKFWFTISLLLSFLAQESFAATAEGKVIRYDLVATRGTANLSGKKSVDFVLLVNGSIPAPTLEFTEGDTAEIKLTNKIPGQEVSIHWHGLLLPPLMDGVPYVNTPPIHSGESFTYRFKLRQSGTYWYHTHTGVQEQKGVYGAFVVHPKKKTIAADKEAVVVISDWSDEDANQILANLRKDGDYYLYKKGTMRSIVGAIEAKALGIYLSNEWTRMGGMDYSDVGYDAFFINGKRDSQLVVAHPGEKIRVRIINAAASTYFHIALGQAPMKVISADGVDMKPVLTREILIGMAETYDLLFEVPEHKNYELKVTAQDGTGSASAWIGMGDKVPAPVKPMPPMYEEMNHGSGHGEHSGHGGNEGHAGHGAQGPDSQSGQDHSKMDHSKMDHAGHAEENAGTPPAHDHSKMGHDEHKGKVAAPAEQISSDVLGTLTVDELRALEKSSFPNKMPVHDVKLVLDGDMERYVWHINGKAIFEERTIEIKEGDVVRFTFVNETMMHHPMHLHGHFFRVLNKYDDYSPWKHTVDVPPHMTRTIEFLANEPGEWMLHCHNLYHMKTGMARVVKYSSFMPSKEIAPHQKNDPHNHDHTYFYGMLEAATNHAQAQFRLTQTWNELDLRLETRKDYSWDLEGDLFYRRWMDRYLNIILGGTSFDHKSYGVVGVGYLLPMLIESNLLVDHEGKLRLDLEKRFQWSTYIFSDADVSFRQDHETEWEVSLMYANSWAWAAGFKFTGESTGFGVQYQF
ncbi:MAG TPA: multicopper oxidase domain-containing protein [Oligoflexus sp.]|uniref:multicopper oxidase domain-containing protein n=1 Tax=Oligoflexus sp. TaxID=1971216 RepID=UPI002D73C4DE|nr:multicopper oxidase domain-containing protein [Oligoflexus sp.]HYX35089.1 multicopper oxidase domain-containing protein [Oligoflexus sp.]